jgi:hypothetical protein
MDISDSNEDCEEYTRRFYDFITTDGYSASLRRS